MVAQVQEVTAMDQALAATVDVTAATGEDSATEVLKEEVEVEVEVA